jgi:hypothetical protein
VLTAVHHNFRQGIKAGFRHCLMGECPGLRGTLFRCDISSARRDCGIFIDVAVFRATFFSSSSSTTTYFRPGDCNLVTNRPCWQKDSMRDPEESSDRHG